MSPFVPMECTYDFRIDPPQEMVRVAINERDAEGELLFASFTGKRRPLTDGALARCFLSHPLMTLKIMGAIHWEALLLGPRAIHFIVTRPLRAALRAPSPPKRRNHGRHENEPR